MDDTDSATLSNPTLNLVHNRVQYVMSQCIFQTLFCSSLFLQFATGWGR